MENDLDMALCEMTKQRDDLLEALKMITSLAKSMGANDDWVHIAVAEEAIAKAEGLHK